MFQALNSTFRLRLAAVFQFMFLWIYTSTGYVLVINLTLASNSAPPQEEKLQSELRKCNVKQTAAACPNPGIIKIQQIVLLFMIIMLQSFFSLQSQSLSLALPIEKKIARLMEKDDIPGLSIVVAGQKEGVAVYHFGFANFENKTKITDLTLFPMASIADGIVALGILKLERTGVINIDKPLSEFLPGFSAEYRNLRQAITIRQLLNHTSGIPVVRYNGMEKPFRVALVFQPGEKFRYNRLNVDLLGAVIQKATGDSPEIYLKKNVLLPLGMVGTQFSPPPETENITTRYKIGFGKARPYNIPKPTANHLSCSGFTNAAAIGRLLLLHLQEENDELVDLRLLADEQIYSMGLYYTSTREGRFAHSGQNPNAGTYIGLDLQKGIGIGVLANSNSPATRMIGELLLNHYSGVKNTTNAEGSTDLDGTFSAAVWVLGILALLVLVYLGSIARDLVTGDRDFCKQSVWRYLGLLASSLIAVPYLFAVYLLPGAMTGMPWSMAAVWMPTSFSVTVMLLVGTLALCYFSHVIITIFPSKNRYFDVIPPAVLLSLLAGAANATVLFIVSNSIGKHDLFYYYFYYFFLAFLTYISCNKLVRTRLIRLSVDIICRLRLRLVHRIFSTTFQRFEEVDRGRVYSTLNYDVENIGNTTLTIINLITNVITLVAIFIFLATISVWAVLFLVLVISGLLLLYYRTNKNARVFFEDARTTRDGYMKLIDGLLNGFKELKLHHAKELEYQDDIEDISDQFREKLVVARIKYVNANLVAQSFLIVSLGTMSFGFPQVFPGIAPMVIISFIMAILYLMGPINFILTSMPAILQMKVSWRRIQDFLKDIPENSPELKARKTTAPPQSIDTIKLENLTFSYKNGDEDSWFTVGPLDFEAQKGELIFIIGGNGSGKTTLAKLLTGLYQPDKGRILINGQTIEPSTLGELYSVVFSDFYLFEKIYNLDGNETADILKSCNCRKRWKSNRSATAPSSSLTDRGNGWRSCNASWNRGRCTCSTNGPQTRIRSFAVFSIESSWLQ